ncbi:MAG TPA: 2'-5' RNA ligase family protein [Bryobacteraceae bacterium]|nr:2'-5' RNA ligase family protein [Bryobacteraceae bacterium]
MQRDPTADRINSYALVSYIPGRLGDFITELRQDLVTGCVARSHVSILPPRPLSVSPEAVAEQIRAGLMPFAPFELDMPRIGVFEQTSVIFCEIGSGREELLELHDAMNTGGLSFDEPFEYHPHVTLAQGIDRDKLPGVYEKALRRWKESAPPSQVLIENVTFVQNTVGNVWIDLEECELRGLATLPVR